MLKEVFSQMQEDCVEDSEEQASERLIKGWQIVRHMAGTSLSSIPSCAEARPAVAAAKMAVEYFMVIASLFVLPNCSGSARVFDELRDSQGVVLVLVMDDVLKENSMESGWRK